MRGQGQFLSHSSCHYTAVWEWAVFYTAAYSACSVCSKVQDIPPGDWLEELHCDGTVSSFLHHCKIFKIDTKYIVPWQARKKDEKWEKIKAGKKNTNKSIHKDTLWSLYYYLLSIGKVVLHFYATWHFSWALQCTGQFTSILTLHARAMIINHHRLLPSINILLEDTHKLHDSSIISQKAHPLKYR